MTHGITKEKCLINLFLVLTENSLAVGLARVGCDDQTIVSGTLKELSDTNLGSPLHSLIIVGDVDHIEVDMLKLFCTNTEVFNSVT